MSYDFPANPTEGQEFVPPVGGQTYVFHSPRWLVKGIPPTGSVGGGGGISEAPVDTKQYARQDAAWTEVIPNPTWSTLAGKPATFPPTLPIAQSGITNLTTDLAGKVNLAGDTMTGSLSLPLGLATATALNFGTPGSGLFTSGTTVAVSVGGVLRATFGTTSLLLTVVAKTPDGAVGAPAYSFAGETTSGLYKASAGNISMAVAGAQTMNWSTAATTSNVQLILPNGTAAATSLNFGTAGTGLFAAGTNSVRFATTGVERLNIGDTLATFSTNVQTNGGAVYIHAAVGSHAYLWLRNESAVAQGLLYWDRSTDAIRVRRIDAAGSAAEGDLAILPPGAAPASALTFNSQTVWNNGNFPLDIVTNAPNTTTLSALVWDGTKYVPGSGGATVAYVDAQDATKANVTHTHAQSDITNLTTDLSNRLLKTGGNMTGQLGIHYANPTIDLQKQQGGIASITAYTGTTMRWQMMLGDNYTETGVGNAGSNFALNSFDDAGTYIGQAINVNRATGLMTVAADPTAALGVATKQYVDKLKTISIAMPFPGKPAAAGMLILPVTFPITVASALVGTAGFAYTAPTATVSFTLYKISSAGAETIIGTVGVTAATKTGFVLAGTGGSLVVGDSLMMKAPVTQDATLSDVTITLQVVRA